MNFVSEEIEKYSTIHSESESELLKKLYRETHLSVLNPRMISVALPVSYTHLKLPTTPYV